MIKGSIALFGIDFSFVLAPNSPAVWINVLLFINISKGLSSLFVD
jgi:hypothetical protein